MSVDVTRVGDDAVLTWPEQAGAKGIQVRRHDTSTPVDPATLNEEDWTRLAFLAGTATTYTDVGALVGVGDYGPAYRVLPTLPGALPTTTLYRINAGGPTLTGWRADGAGSLSPYTEAGMDRVELTTQPPTKGPSVPGYVPTQLFETLRWRGGEDHLRYRMRHGAGDHTVRLFFCERTDVGAGGRRFHVDLDGQRVLHDYDVYATAGGFAIGVMEQFTRTYAGHGYTLVELFPGTADAPIISGVEVLGPAPGDPPAPTIVGHAGPNRVTTERT